jgi:hypothetical protein
MKYLKMLALTAVAAGALMAFIGAGTASATVLCSTTVNVCPTAQTWGTTFDLDFSIPAGGSVNLVDTSGNTINTCNESTVEGKLTNTGSATSTPTGSLTTPLETTGLTWKGCSFPTKTVSTSAKLEIHRIAGTSNGTLTADGEIEVTINTFFFGSCIYRAESGISLGDVTEGLPAVFHANAIVRRTATNPACPETAVWTGTYTLTSPANTTLSVADSEG